MSKLRKPRIGRSDTRQAREAASHPPQYDGVFRQLPKLRATQSPPPPNSKKYLSGPGRRFGARP